MGERANEAAQNVPGAQMIAVGLLANQYGRLHQAAERSVRDSDRRNGETKKPDEYVVLHQLGVQLGVESMQIAAGFRRGVNAVLEAMAKKDEESIAVPEAPKIIVP